jgi:alpha-1,6-mannosyltransferase
VVVATLVALAMLSHLANDRRSSDAHLHAAVIEALADDPLHPPNPMVRSDDADAEESPYLLAVGLAAAATGWSGYEALDAAGIVTLVVFLVLFPFAVGSLTGRRSAAAPALLLTLFAWGYEPWRWSGYLGINSLGFGLGYPSMAAWCGLLGAVLLTDRLRRHPTTLLTGALGLDLAFVALAHPITLVGTVPLVVGISLRGAGDTRPVRHLVAALAIGAVLALLWPLYDITRLLTGGDAYDLANKATYLRVPQRTFLAAVGLVPLIQRARRDRLDPLVLGAATAALVIALGAVTERWIAGRAMPFLLFALHLACAAWLVEAYRSAATRARGVALASGLALVCLAGAVGSTDGMLALTPRSLLPASVRAEARTQSEVAASRSLDAGVDGAVVVGTDLRCLRAATGRGLRTVAPAFATPYVSDTDARWSDSDAYLSGSEAERAVIAERWDIRYVLVAEDQVVDLGARPLLSDGGGCRLFAANP